MQQMAVAMAVANAEQPAAATRYLVSVYALDPVWTSTHWMQPAAAPPEVNTITCIMLYKGCMSDNDLRSFIESHIMVGGSPPVLTFRRDEETMQTSNFVTLRRPDGGTTPLPAICEQLRGLINGHDLRWPAFNFGDSPLLDAAGHTVGVLSLELAQWQHTCDVVTALGARLIIDGCMVPLPSSTCAHGAQRSTLYRGCD